MHTSSSAKCSSDCNVHRGYAMDASRCSDLFTAACSLAVRTEQDWQISMSLASQNTS